jgi:adenosylcobinamide-GDP ribazoletransferase
MRYDARMRESTGAGSEPSIASRPSRLRSLQTHGRALRAAAGLLTRVPVGGFPFTDDELRWSSAYLPLVGAAIGAALGLAFPLFARAGSFVAAAAVVALSLLLTGAIHEDGLADTADALGGGATPERVLAILKDSRIGAFGAAALTSTLLLRVAALARLGPLAPSALVLAHGVSRLAPTLLLILLPYVTPSTARKSGPLANARAPQGAVAVAGALAIAVSVARLGALSALEIAAALGAATLVIALAGARFYARAGGVTGDFLGAAQQLAECAMLLTLAVVRGDG